LIEPSEFILEEFGWAQILSITSEKFREICVCYVNFSREFLPMAGQTAQFSRIWGEFPQVIEANYVAGRFFAEHQFW
jgi:hypothetical protein